MKKHFALEQQFLFARNSRLLNAGKTTDFKFKIEGSLPDIVFQEINDSDVKLTLKERISKLYKNNCDLKFEYVPNAIFSSNMLLIDSMLPQILAHMLLNFYSSSFTKTVDLLKSMEENNPIGFDLSNHQPFYVYKLKRFYIALALGMTPTKVWDGEYDAKGGYLNFKDDGDVLRHHLYNKNELENYLIENTKFETANTSSYDFGSVYEENECLYMNLNLQVRFLKWNKNL